MPKVKEGIRLAEASDWIGLQKLVEQTPMAAQEKDDYGMYPIHWAATESGVPLAVLDALLVAFPMGARTPNGAALLPIHIAVRAKTKEDFLRRLLEAYPESILEETTTGETPVILGKRAQMPHDTLRFLIKSERRMRDLVGQTTREMHDEPQVDVDASEGGHHYPHKITMGRQASLEPTTFHTALKGKPKLERHKSLSDIEHFDNNSAEHFSEFHLSSDEEEGIRSNLSDDNLLLENPPEWSRDEACYICRSAFGMFRLRHHCRNCGKSICGDHCGGKLSIPSKGFFDPQRCCVICFSTLQTKKTESNKTAFQRKASEDLQVIESPSAYSSRMLSSGTNRSRADSNNEASIKSLKHQVISLQKQVESLTQTKMAMQNQILEQEEIQAKTMLLLTETMTRVSVLELQSDGNHS